MTWSRHGITVAGRGVSGAFVDYLYYPYTIIIDGTGAMYITDTENHRVVKWTRDNSRGIVVAGQSNNQLGSSNIELYRPADLAWDSNNNLYIADAWNHRIQEWSSGVT